MKSLSAGLQALTTVDELAEVQAVGTKREPVKLRRTFNQKTYDANLRTTGVIRFWRIIGPVGHPSLNSDLSYQGLVDWGIILKKETI